MTQLRRLRWGAHPDVQPQEDASVGPRRRNTLGGLSGTQLV
jgi:hypothetical protein